MKKDNLDLYYILDHAYNNRELKEIVKTYAYAGFMKNLIAVKDYALKQNNQKVYKAINKISKEVEFYEF